MAMREDILTPIAGSNPSGADLRYDSKLPVYDKIREARRQDDDLEQGAWRRERKVADYPLAAKLAQEALATRSKDLQLAAWLTEAMLRTESFPGLRQGLLFCHDLIAHFWETLYPPSEDGDLELRAAPLDWLGSSLEIPVKSMPLASAGYDWFKYKESRLVGYEEQAQSDRERKLRAQRVADGKITGEAFDKAFAETPKAFYAQTERDLDGCLEACKKLDGVCTEKFGDAAPSLGKLKSVLEEVRQPVHSLLEKKREKEPDPVEKAAATPDSSAGDLGSHPEAVSEVVPGNAPSIVISFAGSEAPERREAIASIATAAAFLRRLEPHSPAPYLMMRGLRWGELRAAARLSDATVLEAPPTELRRQIKQLALSQRWPELLETAENAMSLPCSRAWLDLQRLTVEACRALGGPYEAIGAAIGSELRTLVTDLPELLDASLMDDTPAANSETRAWLRRLLDGTQGAGLPAEASSDGTNGAAQPSGPAWTPKKSDPFSVAKRTLAAGEVEKAFEIMHQELARQRSGRGRFERTLQLVQLCVASGKNEIAQPLVEDLAAMIEQHKLEDWEEREVVAAALSTIMNVSKRVQANNSERQKLYDRICRLHPVRALGKG
jgi:type VI secretion system protein ImpA